MRFYTQQHRHYCGIDLHARSMYICILDQAGKTLVHKKLSCDPDEFLKTLRPYRKDLVVAVERRLRNEAEESIFMRLAILIELEPPPSSYGTSTP
jgi:hypothetical protein